MVSGMSRKWTIDTVRKDCLQTHWVAVIRLKCRKAKNVVANKLQTGSVCLV